jgi:hypothetical protein
MNLRQLVESNNLWILEDYTSGFGMPVELINPDGETQIYSANDPDPANPSVLLAGQVVLHSTVADAEGVPMVSDIPSVTLRRSSLDRIPLRAEKHLWYVKAPEGTDPLGPKTTYLMDEPAEGGEDIGIITLYLIKAKQSA